MRPQTQWNLAAASALVGLWLLGGCCIGVGLDLRGGGKSVLIPQVVLGVVLLVVPTLAVAVLFTVRALGYRPAEKIAARLQKYQLRRDALKRDLSPPQEGPAPQVPASWTPLPFLPGTLMHLGELERVFGYTEKREKTFNIVLSGAACAGGLLLLVLLPFRVAQGVPNVALFVAVALTASVGLIAGGVFALIVLLKPIDLRILICERALVRVKEGRFVVFLWDDILELYQTITDVYQYGLVHTSREYGFGIYRCDGHELLINEGVNAADVAALSDILQSKIAARWLPRALQQGQAGQPVAFGPLTITSRGIESDDESIPWEQIEAVKISRGVITVKKAGQWLAWSRVAAGDIPNLYVFLSVVDRILGVQRG
ncbi:MAG TPA: DUF6585 family protein [Gemmataceae bacterium]|jgi:hypothetical protein|nr:DUF6585 family protein [Gemmataceae bacterium]